MCSVIVVLANVAYASIYLNAFELGLNETMAPDEDHDPFHNFTDVVDGTAGVWFFDIFSLLFFGLECVGALESVSCWQLVGGVRTCCVR